VLPAECDSGSHLRAYPRPIFSILSAGCPIPASRIGWPGCSAKVDINAHTRNRKAVQEVLVVPIPQACCLIMVVPTSVHCQLNPGAYRKLLPVALMICIEVKRNKDSISKYLLADFFIDHRLLLLPGVLKECLIPTGLSSKKILLFCAYGYEFE